MKLKVFHLPRGTEPCIVMYMTCIEDTFESEREQELLQPKVLELYDEVSLLFGRYLIRVRAVEDSRCAQVPRNPVLVLCRPYSLPRYGRTVITWQFSVWTCICRLVAHRGNSRDSESTSLVKGVWMLGVPL